MLAYTLKVNVSKVGFITVQAIGHGNPTAFIPEAASAG